MAAATNAQTFDRVGTAIFALCKACSEQLIFCDNCASKLRVSRQFLSRGYWIRASSRCHFESRLICLNKVYPRTPKLEDRTIVVSSPVIQLLEAPSLQKLRSKAKLLEK
jgi:hypothetical protein